MKYNIYTEGNYFTIKSEVDEYFYGHRKDVIVDKDNINLKNYRIFNVKDFSDKIILKVGNILKLDNSPYTQVEWETFYKENTGNFNGGGTAPSIVNSNWNAITGVSQILNKPTLLSQFTNDIFTGTNEILVILNGTPIENSTKLQAVVDSGLYTHIMTLGGECDILVLSGVGLKSIGSLNESSPLIFKLSPASYQFLTFKNCKLIEISGSEMFFCSGDIEIDINSPQIFIEFDNCNFSKITITNNNFNVNIYNLTNVLNDLKSNNILLPNIFLEIKNSEITFNVNQTNMNAIFINCKINNPILNILAYIPSARIVNCLDINNVLINQ